MSNNARKTNETTRHEHSVSTSRLSPRARLLPLISSTTTLLLVLLALSPAEPIKFHPIGDSTTEAYELETAWRYWL